MLCVQPGRSSNARGVGGIRERNTARDQGVWHVRFHGVIVRGCLGAQDNTIVTREIAACLFVGMCGLF